MFEFVVKYCKFLKGVPGLALVFDAWLKLWAFITQPSVLDWMDQIEAEVLTGDATSATTHKYGGLQLNYRHTEMGHIHSNGLFDALLSRKLKEQLMKCDSQVQHHHTFKNTGWISFYMQTEQDREFVLRVLKGIHKHHADKGIL